jgi:hypothetical protein
MWTATTDILPFANNWHRGARTMVTCSHESSATTGPDSPIPDYLRECLPVEKQAGIRSRAQGSLERVRRREKAVGFRGPLRRSRSTTLSWKSRPWKSRRRNKDAPPGRSVFPVARRERDENLRNAFARINPLDRQSRQSNVWRIPKRRKRPGAWKRFERPDV